LNVPLHCNVSVLFLSVFWTDSFW